MKDKIKIYIIHEMYGKVEQFVIEDVREFMFGFRFYDERVPFSTISPDEFYTELCGYMYGTDKELLIKKWNEKISLEISEHEKQIEKLRDKYMNLEIENYFR